MQIAGSTQNGAKRLYPEVRGPMVGVKVLTADPTPGVDPHRPQECLVGVTDAVVQGEASAEQRCKKAEDQEEDDDRV